MMAAHGERVAAIRRGLVKLREARDELRAAGARRAADYVARAVKSAEGAERHALRLEMETRAE